MLQNLKELYGHQLAASDGAIGRVKDFYFDDQTWAVRYVVADTGTWLSERMVLLSPHAFGRLELEAKLLHINLTRKKIEDSPAIDTHRPVSRQYEVAYNRYYGWPNYWEPVGVWGETGLPVVMPPATPESVHHRGHNQRDDVHLRSAQSVAGYQIHAKDGPLGTVSSFLLDPKTWLIRQVVVETGHWYAGKEILIPVSKVGAIRYEESRVEVALTQAELKDTPEHEVARSGA
jgi:sporulation protein YlmC with PRC-barrel domain